MSEFISQDEANNFFNECKEIYRNESNIQFDVLLASNSSLPIRQANRLYLNWLDIQKSLEK